MAARTFLDSNILVYQLGSGAPRKQPEAQAYLVAVPAHCCKSDASSTRFSGRAIDLDRSAHVADVMLAPRACLGMAVATPGCPTILDWFGL